MPRLFAYGTLQPGEPNEHVLEGIDGMWQPATVRGTLIDEGWGAEIGYPALQLDEGAEEVRGQLLTSVDLAKHWERLDAFEGPGYRRVIADVQLVDASVVAANLYVVHRQE